MQLKIIFLNPTIHGTLLAHTYMKVLNSMLVSRLRKNGKEWHRHHPATTLQLPKDGRNYSSYYKVWLVHCVWSYSMNNDAWHLNLSHMFLLANLLIFQTYIWGHGCHYWRNNHSRNLSKCVCNPHCKTSISRRTNMKPFTQINKTNKQWEILEPKKECMCESEN